MNGVQSSVGEIGRYSVWGDLAVIRARNNVCISCLRCWHFPVLALSRNPSYDNKVIATDRIWHRAKYVHDNTLKEATDWKDFW